MGCAWKISRKYQGIWLMLEIIREISGKMFVVVSSLNPSPTMLKNRKKTHYAQNIILLVFVFHDGNRAHFAQIDESLLK